MLFSAARSLVLRSVNSALPTTSVAMRSMSGFASLSPRSLDEILKRDLISNEPADRMEQIWLQYHETSRSAIGYTIGSAEHDIISQRMKDCPLFIWPVFKENDEDHFVLLSQMQDKFVLCTFLEEYKRSPDTASPWITVAVYDDFCKEKNMALVRGDFTPNLTKAEGDTTSRMILHGYHDDEAFKHIHNFNKQPDQFDYNNFLTFFKSF